MKKPEPFEKGERICFIGDSITANCEWVSAITEYYATHRKDKPVKIIPCGVAGGGVISSLTYYNENVAVHSPTTVVIMLGMNDIGRQHYEGEIDEAKLANQKKALEKYEKNLYALTEQAKVISRVSRIIYLTPTPYDEEMVCSAPCAKGCFSAIRSCADIMKKIADEYDCEYYDNGMQFYELLSKARAIGCKDEFIKPDRVHPNMLGMAAMARLFLCQQGFNDMCVTPQKIIDGEVSLVLGEAASKYNEIAKKVQERWTSEWLVARFSPDYSQQGKFNFTNNYEKYVPGRNAMFNGLADRYEGLVKNYNNNIRDLYEAIDQIYK